jgi:hypothetical protein
LGVQLAHHLLGHGFEFGKGSLQRSEDRRPKA